MFIQVYDDLIPEYLQDYYALTVLGRTFDKGVPNKVIHPSIEFKCKYEDTAVDERGYAPMSFFHVLKSAAGSSTHFDNFFEIPRIFCRSHELILREVLAARIYLILPYQTEQKHYRPHVDFPYPHTVLLYYVNDADGNTVFFNKQKEVVQEVEPKKGRLLVFDGTIYHGGGIPKQNPRCVVNFDILCHARADPGQSAAPEA
jgi:2OG-Fe(II) oxygenase superfamily